MKSLMLKLWPLRHSRRHYRKPMDISQDSPAIQDKLRMRYLQHTLTQVQQGRSRRRIKCSSFPPGRSCVPPLGTWILIRIECRIDNCSRVDAEEHSVLKKSDMLEQWNLQFGLDRLYRQGH